MNIEKNEWVPRDSFIGRYLTYMQSQETAALYDMWCALWCVSAACARATYVDRPRAPVYLNMFVVLVGDSGIPRKSTSVSTASKLAHTVIDRCQDITFLDAKMTPEQLELMLHTQSARYGNAQICIAVSELAVFMGVERYIAHMPTLLTELYDCPTWRHGGGTIARGEVLHHNVWIHLLSASTPAWLLKTVNPNVIEGGFTSRCYFVVANQPKQHIPWPQEPDADMYQDMCDDLAIIAREARSRPPIKLHDDARSVFTEWYRTRPRALDTFKQSFESREDAHVLRIAALLCINDGTWIIHDMHILAAIDMLHKVKDTSAVIFESAEVRSKYASALDIMRMHLINQGMEPISRGRLYMKMRSRLTVQEYAALLDLLSELGAVQRFQLHGEQGRPTTVLRGTQALLDIGLNDKVSQQLT